MKQSIAILPLTTAESAVVNAKKRVAARFWTHKVVYGCHAVSLQTHSDPGIAQTVIKNWPEIFDRIAPELPPGALPVEQANPSFLFEFEEKFGDPNARAIAENHASIARILAEPPEEELLATLPGAIAP